MRPFKLFKTLPHKDFNTANIFISCIRMSSIFTHILQDNYCTLLRNLYIFVKCLPYNDWLKINY